MPDQIRVLNLYEGFFAGGARILHTDVVAGLHGAFQRHSVLSLAARARREGTEQHLSADPRYLRLRAAGVDVRTLGMTAGSVPPGRDAFTAEQIEIAAEAVAEADVIVSLKEQPLGILLALRDAGLLPRVPVAVTLHRSDPDHSGPALGWLQDAVAAGIVTATISCAVSTRDAYARAGANPGTALVVRNGIDTDRFVPASFGERARIREALGIPADAPVVVHAARFDEMKDPGLFLRAVSAHAAARPDTHYLMCGAGETFENERFRALVAEAGLPASVNLQALGIRHDMPQLYGAADIVALTSAYGEASPLCLLEGAACGATPVTTDVGDAARTVAGIGAVTSRDPRDIAFRWERVLAARPRLRMAAFAARGRFGRDRMIGEYDAALRSLLPALAVAA